MYTKRQLNNGFRVIVSPMPHMASVSLGIWIGVGGRYESAKQSGISHLIEHMVFKGTVSRSATQLKRSIEGIGGAFNGFTSDEVTCYTVKVPEKHLDLGLDILTDMTFNARFDAADMAKEKLVISEEIKMYKDQPADHVVELLGGLMWPDNSLGRPLTGTIANVRKFKRNEMVAFKEGAYHPANMVLVAAGRVDPEKMFGYASKEFRGRRKRKPAFDAPSIRQKHPRMKFVGKNINQTQIAMGFHAGSGNIRERFSMKMLSIILGENMSSRLFEELREKYGLCYDIASMYKRHSDTGEFIIHAGVDNTKALGSVVAILDELRKIKDLGVTEDELVRAKEFAKGQFLLAMESTSARMMWFGGKFMIDRHAPGVPELLRQIDDVSREGVKKAAGNIFTSSSLNLAMIGATSKGVKNKIRTELGRL